MTIPHHFPSLIKGPAQVVLIAGSGLSAPTLPTVDGGLKEKLDRVAQDDLGIPPNGTFYELADTVLNALKVKGKSDAECRLWIAERLGMLDDRSWFGEIGVPLSGNTPRHRALARFVVEKRLKAIISLNWDALLEAALDSVGLTDATNSPHDSPRPWEITAYTGVVDDSHVPSLADARVFPVVKPHGCVRQLEHVRRRYRAGQNVQSVTFKLAQSDLDVITGQENIVNVQAKAFMTPCPLIGVGWRAQERYLRSAIVEIAKKTQRKEPDAFTLIDLRWDSNHTEISAAYGRNESQAFAKVARDTDPTTDCLFQWLQARYALIRVIDFVPRADQASLQIYLNQLDQPDCSHPILSWADCWLPTWVRLCWRSGAMQGVDPQTSKLIGPLDIPVVPRDAHVPLTGIGNKRRDLHAAAKLLVALSGSINRFRFEMFPGGLWDPEKHFLYLPLPGWKESELPCDLAALKPLVEALRGFGYVKRIFLIWLNSDEIPPDPILRHQLDAHVRNLMPLTGFAAENSFTWVDLETLKGD